MKPGSRIAHFEVIDLIGAGGMGEVYRARDTRLGRDVAVKVLPAEFAVDPERLRRFEQEARAVAALSHPNVLAVYDVGTHEGSPYLVTELLEGESLQDRLRPGALSVRKAVETAVQIAQGLAAAHEKGIVHRDLKPGNLFITRGGHVKILDFGLAKLAPLRTKEEQATATTVTEATDAGTVLGTAAYMSPEQVRGKTVDQRSDIFAFGCVLYEMLSGRRAFTGATRADTLSAILHDEPPGLDGSDPRFPGPLRQIVRRCLEKRPADRFSSAHDLAFALEAAGSETSQPAARPAVAESWLRRWWLATAVMVIGAVAVVVGLLLTQAGRPDRLPPFHPRQVTGELGMEGKAAISPSGEEIAYTVREGDKSNLWITDIRGGRPLCLTAASIQASDPAWFADGSAIAFTSSEGPATSIWKVPRFGGTAMLLVSNAEQAALSPDGTRIVFARSEEDSLLRIWVASLSAPEDARKITGAVDGLYDHKAPAWSPDGKTICYADDRDLWVVPADGGKAHPLMKDDPVDDQPAWSADGRFIYFRSTREGTTALWRIHASGGEPVRVTDGTGSEQFPSLSRGGRLLAFVSRRLSGGIALVDLQTNKVARFQEGSLAYDPAIRPDRGALVFVRELAGSGAMRSVPLRDNAPAGDSMLVTEQPGYPFTPVFSPDGRWLAYELSVRGQRGVWVAQAQGGPPVNFSNQAGEPAWSPDSRQIAFLSDDDSGFHIAVAAFAAGHRAGEPRRLTRDAGGACFPSWSSDGRTIAYVVATQEAREVWATPADGSGPSRRLTSGAGALYLRWFGSSGRILVSGYWGEQVPTFRLLSPETGALSPFALPEGLALDRDSLEFDVSLDGRLLAIFEGEAESTIWVRGAEVGSF